MADTTDSLYATFFDNLKTSHESEHAFLDLLPSVASGASQALIDEGKRAGLLQTKQDVAARLQGIFQPALPDLKTEWEAAKDDEDDISTESGEWADPVDAGDKTDEHGMVTVPLGREQVPCILDAPPFEVKDTSWLPQPAPDEASAFSPSTTTTPAQLTTSTATTTQASHAPTASLDAAKAHATGPTPDLPGVLPDALAARHHLLSDQLLHSLNTDIATHLGLADNEQHTATPAGGCEPVPVHNLPVPPPLGPTSVQYDNVETFSLDPDFDYDTVELTLRDAPHVRR